MTNLRGESADPEGIAVRNTDLARVYAELPALYRQVLVLAGDGFDYGLIADVLNLPSPEAAKQMLYRARRRARRKLGANPSVVIFAAWRFPHRVSATTQDLVQNLAPTSSQTLSGAAAVAAAMGMSFVLSIGGPATGSAAVASPPHRATVSAHAIEPRALSRTRPLPQTDRISVPERAAATPELAPRVPVKAGVRSDPPRAPRPPARGLVVDLAFMVPSGPDDQRVPVEPIKACAVTESTDSLCKQQVS
jgi:hypothetical protein